jgi:RNA polymerase subunit RPABC4/transcription elongation factor Spt4
MKKCPKCNSEVEDNFDMCWNCQYSFVDMDVLDVSEFQLICPTCNFVVEASSRMCPNCHHDLSDVEMEMRPQQLGDRSIDCLRCNVALKYRGNYRFHEGTRVGALGDLFELFTNRESFDLYSCPNCGKVEFFLPQID